MRSESTLISNSEWKFGCDVWPCMSGLDQNWGKWQTSFCNVTSLHIFFLVADLSTVHIFYCTINQKRRPTCFYLLFLFFTYKPFWRYISRAKYTTFFSLIENIFSADMKFPPHRFACNCPKSSSCFVRILIFIIKSNS